MLLRAEDVARQVAGRTLFEGVTIDVRAGDRIGLVGANGSGKSTLLRLLAGDEAPDAGRLLPEVHAALPTYGKRALFLARHAGRVLASPMSPRRMADRLRIVDPPAFCAACSSVTAPTLVVTGEARLDRVVPVESTRRYLDLIRDAVAV